MPHFGHGGLHSCKSPGPHRCQPVHCGCIWMHSRHHCEMSSHMDLRCRQAIKAALKEGTPAGQDIVEELDRMTFIGSPRDSSEIVASPSAQMWSSPVARWTRAPEDLPDTSFHQPFRESKPGYPQAFTSPVVPGSHDLLERALLLDKRGADKKAGPSRTHKGPSID